MVIRKGFKNVGKQIKGKVSKAKSDFVKETKRRKAFNDKVKATERRSFEKQTLKEAKKRGRARARPNDPFRSDIFGGASDPFGPVLDDNLGATSTKRNKRLDEVDNDGGQDFSRFI